MSMNVGINGFGRIGRNFFRAAINNPEVNIVAINDLGSVETLAHLLKYDSIQGVLPYDVKVEGNNIVVNNKSIAIFKQPQPENIPWKSVDVDIVIESTGKFTSKKDVEGHIKAGAKKVIVSAPSNDADFTMVMGVNEDQYIPGEHSVISNASCTTNCLMPVLKVMYESFGIEKGMMTTIHSYTNDQRILDFDHKDLRRARAAGLSQIPTSTGASKVVAKVMPSLEGKITGMAVRVPTPNVSLIDLVLVLKKDVTEKEVNESLKEYSNNSLKGILDYCDLPLVSSDFKGSSCSATVDALSTTVLQKNMVKVLAWYDNEWGYSNRLLDIVLYINSKNS